MARLKMDQAAMAFDRGSFDRASLLATEANGYVDEAMLLEGDVRGLYEELEDFFKKLEDSGAASKPRNAKDAIAVISPFGGDFVSWPKFAKAFEQQTVRLDVQDKLVVLERCLPVGGEAMRAITGSVDFAGAWKKLEERFCRPEKLFEELLTRIEEEPIGKPECKKSMDRWLFCLRQWISCAQLAKLDVDKTFNVRVMEVLMEKLPIDWIEVALVDGDFKWELLLARVEKRFKFLMLFKTKVVAEDSSFSEQARPEWRVKVQTDPGSVSKIEECSSRVPSASSFKHKYGCYRCGSFGHRIADCKSSSTRPGFVDGLVQKPRCCVVNQVDGQQSDASWGSKDQPIAFQAEIDGKKTDLLVDTGSKYSFLPRTRFPDETGSKRNFNGAFGEKAVAIGPIEKEFVVGATKLKEEVFVADVRQGLVGRQFIRRYQVDWDEEGNVFANVGGKLIVLKLADESVVADFDEVVAVTLLQPHSRKC